MNSKLKWTGRGLLAAFLAFFGYKATTNPAPTPPTGDTAIVAPALPQRPDTPGASVPPLLPGSGSYRTIAADSMEYASTAALRARISTNVGGTGTGKVLYTDGPNAGLATVDPAVQYHGHATMAYTQAAGSGLIPELWANIPPTKHLWARAVIRYSPGWSTVGSGSGANAYKLLGWSYQGYYGSGRVEITNTNQYDFYWGIIDRTTNATVGGGEQTHVSPGVITTEWTDAGWYVYVIEIDQSGTTGVTRVYMGRDGTTPTLRATNTGTMTNGGPLPPVAVFMLGLNFNQSLRAGREAQSLHYGMWEVVDGGQYPNPFGVK